MCEVLIWYVTRPIPMINFGTSSCVENQKMEAHSNTMFFPCSMFGTTRLLAQQGKNVNAKRNRMVFDKEKTTIFSQYYTSSNKILSRTKPIRPIRFHQMNLERVCYTGKFATHK